MTTRGQALRLEDTEIDCRNTNGTAVGEANVTARRLNIHGCENGFDMNQNVTVEDSYIHDLYNGGSAHMDGIQMATGHFVDGHSFPAHSTSRSVTTRSTRSIRTGNSERRPSSPATDPT